MYTKQEIEKAQKKFHNSFNGGYPNWYVSSALSYIGNTGILFLR